MLDDDMAKSIIAGDFEFLYLVSNEFSMQFKCHKTMKETKLRSSLILLEQSPEALLNSPIFCDIYFNPSFQSHFKFSLVVVD
jgi:hypothetical protein